MRADFSAFTPPPYYPAPPTSYPQLPPTPRAEGALGDDLAAKAMALLKDFSGAKQSPALGIIGIVGLVTMGILGVVALTQDGGGKSKG
jgi:hypothetical protein